MTRPAEPAAIVSGKISAIRGALNGISASETGPWPVLDRIRQIVSASPTRSGLEPGGSLSIIAADAPAVLDGLRVAADLLDHWVAGCQDCNADPSELCPECDGRLTQARRYRALAEQFGSGAGADNPWTCQRKDRVAMTSTTDSTSQTSTASACPPWCTFDHAGDRPDDLQHLSQMAVVPCLVTKRADGHICGGTQCSDPAYNEPSCDRPNFAQLLADKDTGVTIEVGHGDDLLPAMTPEAALALAAGIAELARLGGAS